MTPISPAPSAADADETLLRSRWPLVVAAVMLLIVAFPVAWMFRPLNATERAILGTWRLDASRAADVRLTFTSDRRFTRQTGFAVRLTNGFNVLSETSGRWRVRGDSILRDNTGAWDRFTEWLSTGRTGEPMYGVRIESPDRIWLRGLPSGAEFPWTREPARPSVEDATSNLTPVHSVRD